MLVDNFIVAISTGFTGAFLFSVFPVIFKRKNRKVFIEDCVFSFGGCLIIGFIIAFLVRGWCNQLSRIREIFHSFNPKPKVALESVKKNSIRSKGVYYSLDRLPLMDASYIKTLENCYQLKVVNPSQNIKIASGYIESDFVWQNYRCWQEALILSFP